MKNNIILSLAAGILALWSLALLHAISGGTSLFSGILRVCSMSDPSSWLFAACLFFLPGALDFKEEKKSFRSKRPMATSRILASDLFDFPHKEPEPIKEKETITLLEPPKNQREDIDKLRSKRGQFDRGRRERALY